MDGARWGTVDALLESLSYRNPDLRIVLRGDSPSSFYGTWCAYDGVRSFVVDYFPLVSARHLVKFEHVPRVESRFGKFGSL